MVSHGAFSTCVCGRGQWGHTGQKGSVEQGTRIRNRRLADPLERNLKTKAKLDTHTKSEEISQGRETLLGNRKGEC